MKVNLMYCSLCEKPHIVKQLEEGWFAAGYQRFAHVDTATKLICPECLEKIVKGGSDDNSTSKGSG